MLQLNPPLIRIVVGGPNWAGPTGKGVANLVEPGHRDEDIVWIIDMDETGQTWCVPNRFVRAPTNITYGRTCDPIAKTTRIIANANGQGTRINHQQIDNP